MLGKLRWGLASWFVFGTSVALGLSGLGKVWGSFGHLKLFEMADPIFGMRFGRLMFGAGILECLVAAVCLSDISRWLNVKLIAWLATTLVVYRLGLWWLGWEAPCSCMGKLVGVLHLAPAMADNIMKVILAYLLIGSYGLLIWQWRRGKQLMVES